MKLYTYWLSSASYRARIALEWKGIEREDVFVNLAKGEQLADAYLSENPEGRVPLLVDGATRVAQALAILEYLEETHPEPPLLPTDAAGRARVRQLALAIVADIQPLQNTGPIRYLSDPLGLAPDSVRGWYTHWVTRGLTAFEAHLDAPETGRFCHGDAPTFADLCLVPQVAGAIRGGIDLEPMPRVRRIWEACGELEPFRRAEPRRQPDAPPAQAPPAQTR